MSVRASVLSLFCLLCALGVGYVAVHKYASDEGKPSDQVALVETDLQAPDVSTPDRRQASKALGSANRRMDDFGSGPGGQVVTMPLKDRHRQAFSGSTVSTGGGPATSAGEDGADQIANLNMLMDDGTSGQENAQTPTYRVIDRGPAPELDQSMKDDSSEEKPEAGGATPSFDIVRVDPQGNTILAGRASPFAEVEVKAGDVVIDRVTATALGEWVSTPTEPLGGGDQELSLAATTKDTLPVVSRQVVVVSIPEATADQNTATAGEAVAVLLDREKSGEGRILQAPGIIQGDGQLALSLVDYDDEGAIKLSGEAPAGVPVRIYIDNEPAGLVIGDSKGQWIATLDRDLPGGDYTLRLDQLDKEGETVARLETPFTRVTTPPIEGESKVDYVVVQPGNSLWRIARRLSGDGFNYVYIFEANEAQIRDPDVIYPGQVFEVPADAGIAG